MLLDDSSLLLPTTTSLRVSKGTGSITIEVLSLTRLSSSGRSEVWTVQVNLISATTTSARATAATLFPGGKILVAGCAKDFTPRTGGAYVWTALFDQTTGSQDASFANGVGFAKLESVGSSGCATAVFLQSDGKIMVAGGAEIGGVSSASYFALRLMPNGAFDLNYGVNGTARIGPSGVSSGQRPVCGYSTANGNSFLFGNSAVLETVGAFELSSTGAVVQSSVVPVPFSGAGPSVHFPSLPSSCVRSANGANLVSTRTPDGFAAVMRFLPNSVTLDRSFGVNGTSILSAAPSSGAPLIAVWPSGNIIVASLSGTPPFAISTSEVAGDGRSVLGRWSNAIQQIGQFPTLTDLQLQNNGLVLVSGFSIFDSMRAFVARLEGSASFSACSAGPQCICFDAICTTQRDWVVGSGKADVLSSRVTVVGNIVANSNSVMNILAGSGQVSTIGIATLGGQLIVTAPGNGTFTLVTAAAPLDSQFNSVSAAFNSACQPGSATPQYSGSTLSVSITTDLPSTCLSGGAIAGIVIGCVVFAALAIVAIVGVVLRNRKSKETFALVRAKLDGKTDTRPPTEL